MVHLGFIINRKQRGLAVEQSSVVFQLLHTQPPYPCRAGEGSPRPCAGWESCLSQASGQPPWPSLELKVCPSHAVVILCFCWKLEQHTLLERHTWTNYHGYILLECSETSVPWSSNCSNQCGTLPLSCLFMNSLGFLKALQPRRTCSGPCLSSLPLFRASFSFFLPTSRAASSTGGKHVWEVGSIRYPLLLASQNNDVAPPGQTLRHSGQRSSSLAQLQYLVPLGITSANS